MEAVHFEGCKELQLHPRPPENYTASQTCCSKRDGTEPTIKTRGSSKTGSFIRCPCPNNPGAVAEASQQAWYV